MDFTILKDISAIATPLMGAITLMVKMFIDHSAKTRNRKMRAKADQIVRDHPEECAYITEEACRQAVESTLFKVTMVLVVIELFLQAVSHG